MRNLEKSGVGPIVELVEVTVPHGCKLPLSKHFAVRFRLRSHSEQQVATSDSAAPYRHQQNQLQQNSETNRDIQEKLNATDSEKQNYS